MERSGTEVALSALLESSPLRKMVIQPCCMNHCRDWRETAGGLPASNHSPACENYKTETFYMVTVKGEKGPWCIMPTLEAVAEAFPTVPGEEEYDVVPIEMTRDQYEHLDEFDGF